MPCDVGLVCGELPTLPAGRIGWNPRSPGIRSPETVSDAKEPMMAIHPKQPKDLVLAPVAVAIDINLQRLRDRPPSEVEAALELELDRPAKSGDPGERARLVLRQALRSVDLRGWTAAISDDRSRLHLEGGSVSIDLALSAGITAYIDEGWQAELGARAR